MSMLNKTAVLAVMVLLSVGSQAASAMGFGPPSHTTALGQALDFAVPVSADSTEQLTSECISTELLVGDTRMPSSAVRSRLESLAASGTRVLRVTSSVRIDEPVVVLTVAVGCPVRLKRQFVLFIDPPPQAASDPVNAVPRITETAVAPPATVSGPAAAQMAPTEFPAVGRPDLPTARRPLALAKLPSATSARAASSAPAGVVRADEAPTGRKPLSQKPARSLKPSPRLQLEADARPAPSQAAAAAVADLLASAASAAAAASEAQTTAQHQREAMQSMQKQMESVKAQADAANKSIAQLQLSLSESQESSNRWLLVAGALAAAVVALLAAVVRLLRQRSATSGASAAWWNAEPNKPEASVEQETFKAQRASADLPSGLEMPLSESVGDTNLVTASGWQASQGPTLASAREPLTPMPADTQFEHDRAPFLTAGELIDLGQQADFLVALGQDDSAVSLLDSHLPMDGGGGAWPYLKLLEIHRRRADQASFERVRERFERRFGVSPAGWRDGPVAGKPLDAYDGVITRIAGVWGEPEEALRLIETLMVRGDDNVRYFDLAAMGDLQSLYLLAKSLLEPVPNGGEPVDLLLPFNLEADELVETQAPVLESAVAAESTIDFRLELPASDVDSPAPPEEDSRWQPSSQPIVIQWRQDR